ncbi:unnamed protein product [Rotaria sp. Silwood1]|nr:unnamed protein product [Rotaria sp. Silwood1]CAF1683559.1 unnamed protein product [Rotaria sp. Silwood1]
MPVRDCNTKYNIYLLYQNLPKNLSINYSIHIDAFDKITLDYWTSWYLPIPFSFLPVNRIATQLQIHDIEDREPCSLSCENHGRYVRYTNNKSLFFCQCKHGYSGPRCNIQHRCSCANNSYCLTSSICVCSLHKFGPRCYLKISIGQSNNNPCQHNEDYSGERCENINNKITIRLRETITIITSPLFIHFITAFSNVKHEQTTMMKKIPYDKYIITFIAPQSFYYIFIQRPHQNHYLAAIREIFILAEKIYTEILPKQRCSPIEELLNKTFVSYEYFNRTKYYSLICQQYSQLMCFYDKENMCICDLDRFSNCFLVNHTFNYDCQGYNYCDNNGQSFQKNQTCPTKSICTVPDKNLREIDFSVFFLKFLFP